MFKKKEDLWKFALSKIEKNQNVFEFGVFKGESINFMSSIRPDLNFFGFDSFEGLQEDWGGSEFRKSHFDLKGNLPKVNSNVKLIKGWFNKSLPDFLKTFNAKTSLINIDCDTYESSKEVLMILENQIISGTIIIFDEYFGYPGWEYGEKKAFKEFREIPAPKRGELVRQFGNKLREEKELLGTLVSYEMGKSYQEGLGEVQEMIDICDFAVGLSRQLHGLTMHSERPTHRMYEQYHPLGIVGIISAFNFPVAVWSWNVALSWVCGNVTIWKPSEKTPLCSIVCQKIIAEVLKENNIPEGVSCIINGDYKIGEMLSQSKDIPLISATGSTRMGKIVAEKVGARLGKTLLELGGNNAIIVTPEADLKMTIMGSVFGAVGTCGQRCTSMT